MNLKKAEHRTEHVSSVYNDSNLYSGGNQNSGPNTRHT